MLSNLFGTGTGCKGEHCKEASAVLDLPPVAGRHMAELPVDDAKGMLDLGPDRSLYPVDALVEQMQLVDLEGVAQVKRQANDPGISCHTERSSPCPAQRRRTDARCPVCGR